MFHINQKFNLAIKRLTMYLQYHGLSRLGIQMLSFKGICVNPRTADRTTSTRIRMQSSMVAALIHEGRAIIGIDNYNHAWGSPIVSPERQSQLVLANYTTCGVSKYQVHVDNTFLINDAGEFLPSIPPEKIVLSAFVRQAVRKIVDEMKPIEEKTGGLHYWELSQVVADSIGAVPLRADNTNPNPAPRGRQYYIPWFVSGRNCAANVGILHILTTIFNEYQHLHEKEMYGYMKADVSIYLKYLQVGDPCVALTFLCRSCTHHTVGSTATDSCSAQFSNTFTRTSTRRRVSGKKTCFCDPSSLRFCITSCQIRACDSHRSCS